MPDVLRDAIDQAIVEEVREIVARETKRTVREREEEMAALVRTTVALQSLKC